MQAGDVQPEGSPLRLEIKKETLADKLESMADELERRGVTGADQLRELGIKGVVLFSSGLRRSAKFLRRTNIPDLILTEEKAELGRLLTPIAIGLGAGLITGLILKKAVK